MRPARSPAGGGVNAPSPLRRRLGLQPLDYQDHPAVFLLVGLLAVLAAPVVGPWSNSNSATG